MIPALDRALASANSVCESLTQTLSEISQPTWAASTSSLASGLSHNDVKQSGDEHTTPSILNGTEPEIGTPMPTMAGEQDAAEATNEGMSSPQQILQ